MLREDYPGLDPENFGSTEEIPAGDMSVYGVVIRGVNYSGGCVTRHGRYPYCDEMPLPSYSLAKTVTAGFALMRLELLHPGVRNALVTELLPECREAGGWDGVTFEHLLDRRPDLRLVETTVDEKQGEHGRFFLSTTPRKNRDRLHWLPAKIRAGRALGLPHVRHLHPWRGARGVVAEGRRAVGGLLRRSPGRAGLSAS